MIEFDSEMHVDLIQHVGSDSMVVSTARVSTQGNDSQVQEIGTAEHGLINYLMKNRHGTPFEHGSFTFRIYVPIFVMRELHRHRVGFSYNEESGRYKSLNSHFYIPPSNRALTQVGKPGHYLYEPGSPEQHRLVEHELKYAAVAKWTAYTHMLDHGIAREVARMALGVDVYSACYVTCNPRSLMHFLSLRTKNPDATFPSFPMEEITWMADKMEAEFARLMPVTHETFCKNGRVAP